MPEVWRKIVTSRPWYDLGIAIAAFGLAAAWDKGALRTAAHVILLITWFCLSFVREREITHNSHKLVE